MPEDVPIVRSLVKTSFEADVIFPIRFLIDRVDVMEKIQPIILFLDIETDNAGRVPNPEIAEFPIVCMGIHNSATDMYDTFVWRENLSPGDSSQITDEKLHEIHYFRTERDMLEAFVKFFRDCEPDVISGWNLIRFDLKYLVNRMRVLNMNINDLSPMQSAYARDKDIIIKGVALVDLYDAYRRFVPNTEESYKLDFIANKVIGKGKTAGDNDVRFMWKFKLEDLINYNIVDVQITKGIDDKLKLLDFMDELRRLCFCQLEDTLVVSKLIDCYILRYFHNKKVFPTKEHHERKEIEGAFVGTWAKGIYNNVVVFDLRSLYPSIIVSLGLSQESITKTIPKNTDDFIHVSDYYVNKRVKGFLPEVIGTLFAERAKYRNLMKTIPMHTGDWDIWDGRQAAVKILMNAMYGQTAYPNSRIYSPNVAEITTFMGRNILAWTREQLAKLGMTILYADTDGVFFTNGSELSGEEINTIRDKVNLSYNDFAKQFGIDKHLFETEQDKVFRKWFSGGNKKRYAGNVINQGGQKIDVITITGFETRRSDASQFSRTLQHHVFDMLLKQDKSKDEVLRYIGDEIERIRQGKFTFDEIGIPKGMSREPEDYGKLVIEKGIALEDERGHALRTGVPANIRGAKYAQNILGIQISSKPKMLYIKRMPEKYPQTDVLCFDEDIQVPPGTEIDIEKMLIKLVKDKVDSIFDALGWSLVALEPFWRGKPKNKAGEQMTLL